MDERDEEAFRSFVDRKGASLMRTAHMFTANAADAEDLLQEVLGEMARRWPSISTPEAYAKRSMYRRQASKWRRALRIRESSALLSIEATQPDLAAEVGDRVTVKQALERLAPGQRAVLVLRYMEDLPEAAVAELLECSIGTVRSQTHRALRRLKHLAPELDEQLRTQRDNSE